MKTIFCAAIVAFTGFLGLKTTAEPASNWSRTVVVERNAVEKATVVESQWWTTGPLKAKGFGEALFPEQGVDLQAKGANNQALWTEKAMKNGVVNMFNAGASTSTYFYRTLNAKQAGKVRLSFGSDDGIEVWLNGRKVHSNNAARNIAPDQDIVTVELRAGQNELLVKIFNQSGNAGIYYSGADLSEAILASMTEEYPEETRLAKTYLGESWFREMKGSKVSQSAIEGLLKGLKQKEPFQARLTKLVSAGSSAEDEAWMDLFLDVARQREHFAVAVAAVNTLKPGALRLAVQDLQATYPAQYKNGSTYLAAIEAFEKELPQIRQGLAEYDNVALKRFEEFSELSRKAQLENPLLDFEKIVLVKRKASNLCLPQNWQGNSSLDPNVENELATLAYKNPGASIQTLYKPKQNYFVGDSHLNFEADRLLFSSIGTQKRWQIFEIKTDGTGLRQVSKGDEKDVDNYDAVYLPDGRIVYDSSATFQGVPCVGGEDFVGNLYFMNADGSGVRRLCFDQDNDWSPAIMPCGRVMYTRWEYTDSAHYFSRVLMSMNPDGTGQSEVYGANSYWPNSMFYARPLPGSNTKFVAIVSGHHGVPRMGEMVLFDAAKSRLEDNGAIQRIPGYGKPVKGPIMDRLVDDSWPKFLHPYPLSDKYFLVASQPTAEAGWGIYLVDIFDNMLLLKETPGYALLEPQALRPTPRPPVIPDKVKLDEKKATVVVQDIYAGEGLRGVPRGAVKNLRVFEYAYSYRRQGGHYFVGMEGPWDVHRIIGTVPVNEDGSAMFTIPANTPVALQPMDSEGKALQIMRSWFVGMPGEYVSCVGCHEKQNQSASMGASLAARGAAVDPTPWHGRKRGFNFVREVQPVLDKYCVGCHSGKPGRPNFADTTIIPTSGDISPLPKSYLELHPYVRRNGPEGDYHTLTPLEFHADTSLLVQILRKGHYNVKMDEEAWDRLITWIDLNVPAYGTFSEIRPIPSNYEKRRFESQKNYAGLEENIEVYPTPPAERPQFIKPAPMPAKPERVTLPGWPFGDSKARQMQSELGSVDLRLELGNGVFMPLKKIPAGEFVMGDVNGECNEYPMAAVKIAKPFYMGTTEVTLEQFQQFDPSHRNGYYDQHYKDQVRPGYLMDASPTYPVIRISWHQAVEFCKWLSKKTGHKVTLPTEAQWEWACRAGTDSPFYYGNLDTDFAEYANLADASLSKMAVIGIDPQPIPNPDKFWDYLPKEARFNDGALLLADVNHYKANAWGLHDTIGNVAEWTLDTARPYPYNVELASKDATQAGRKVVRGGSWSERPKESRASSRLDYPSWQKVYNVGFRVIVEE